MPHFKNSNNELFWLDEGDDPAVWLPQCTPITDEEAEAIRAVQNPPMTYAQKRAREYPDFRDYLDGVVKGDQAQIDAYIAACQAVKAKYPKP
ncbi:MAG: hypothetical protein EBW87_05990 [Burkholderiaceae bacterium]|nr:hypothetical protein [Burkholderiaceae bacterium]